MRVFTKGRAFSALVGLVLISCTDLSTGPAGSTISPRSPNRTLAGVAKVRISQVYGAGGNANATYANDFVELFNAGDAPQLLDGWSVQYASATGTGNLGASSSQLVTLSGTIQPGQYYLIKANSGGSVGAALPDAQVTNLSLSMAAGAGKVALVDQATSIGCNGSSSVCSSTQLSHIVDLVGYGGTTTAVTFYEGTGPAPALDATNAAFRAGAGCTDTNDNKADFTKSTPAPRNTSTTLAPCSGGGEGAVFTSVTVTASGSLTVGGANATLTAKLLDQNTQQITDGSATYAWVANNPTIADLAAPSTASSATIKAVSAGTATFTVTATSNGVARTGTATIAVTGGNSGGNNGTVTSTTAFVSEIHYDNAGTDANEAMEVELPAGTSLAGWTLLLYDGGTPPATPKGNVYGTASLAGLTPTICGARQVVTVPLANFSFNGAPVSGIQNGSPDGWALVDPDGKVVEFMSYEGAFAAIDGPAAGYTSTDIGKEEGSSTTVDQSLQRAGNGAWFGPVANTMGACNPATPPAPGPQQLIVIQSRSAALPVGYQTQFFLSSGVDGSGATVGNSDVTWSSSNTAVATIDAATGIVTAKTAGSTTLAATAKSDGSYGTTTLTTAVAPIGGSAVRVGHNTELGQPFDRDPSDDQIVSRRQYTLSYNASHGGPNWVAWNLDASHLGSSARCNCFTADPEVSPAYNTSNWVNGGVFSRGHMSPSADWTDADGDNAPTYYLSNMLPQNQTLNSGAWGDLENYLRTQATGANEIYIVAGGIFTKGRTNGQDGLGFIGNNDPTVRILAPDTVWKIAIIVPDGRSASQITDPSQVRVIATKFPNSAEGTGAWSQTKYQSSVREIYRSTGYDFLSALPAGVRCALGGDCDPAARITSSISASQWQTDEGSSVSFDGAASSDPDGDDITYQWSVDGKPAGTGSSLTYTFPQDGTYNVSLLVYDGRGAFNTTLVAVTVLNVAPKLSTLAGATIDHGGTYATSVSFTDPGTDTWAATVDYGDGSGAHAAAVSGKTVSLSHVYAVPGTYTVTLTVSESALPSASDTKTATVTVTNVAPVVNAFGGATILAGESYAAAGSFTDSDADTWTATVNYGDGSGATPLSLSGKDFSLSHVYAAAGTFTVTVSVNDGSDTRSATATVVVKSSAQGVADLAAMVNALTGLNSGQKNSLTMKLESASARLAAGNTTPAVNQLNAFINEIDADLKSGQISAADAAAITSYANRVIANIR